MQPRRLTRIEGVRKAVVQVNAAWNLLPECRRRAHIVIRIDLISPSAAKDHVLATVFRGQPGDPPRRQPGEVTFDLSQWNGQTVRLRLASADNQGPLRAGVDDIRFERIGQQRRTTSLLPSGSVSRIPDPRQSSRSPAYPSRAVPRGWSSSLSSPQPPDSPPREEYVPI